MKNITTAIILSTWGLLMLSGCASIGSRSGALETPEEYCYSVGGEVRTVGNGTEAFCLFSNGDAVELNEFYQKNR